MVAYAWRQITDLPTDWDDLARPDLAELLRQWQQECRYVVDADRIRHLDERLATAWAIETSLLGRRHTISRATIDALAESGPRGVRRLHLAGGLPDEIARAIHEQRAAFDLARDGCSAERHLTLAHVGELHQSLSRSQARAATNAAATPQTEPARPIGTSTAEANSSTASGSPDLDQDELQRLVELHQQHVEAGVSPEVEAAWLHHRIAQLRSHQDGDRRLAHALATIVFLQAGSVPLVIRGDTHREAYRDALAEADAGDIKPLVDLFANVVSAELNAAITYIRGSHGRDIGAIAAAAAHAARRFAVQDERSTRQVTDHYRKLAGSTLRDVAGQLTRAFTEAIPGLRSEQHAWIVSDDLELRSSGGARGRWREQITSAAAVYQYTADLNQYKRWVGIKLPGATAEGQRWHAVVSFHQKESRVGVMAAVLFLTTSDDADARTAASDVARPTILGAKREFIHSGSRLQDDRFLAWLDAALRTALEGWQARI